MNIDPVREDLKRDSELFATMRSSTGVTPSILNDTRITRDTLSSCFDAFSEPGNVPDAPEETLYRATRVRAYWPETR